MPRRLFRLQSSNDLSDAILKVNPRMLTGLREIPLMGHVTILFTKTGMLKASYANPQLFPI